MAMQVRVPVTESSQVGEARRAALRLAHPLPLTESRRADIALVATELATNLARHAQGGQLLLQTIRSNGAEFFELLSIDSGPGIADLHRSMQDGYSTGGTAGTGLGAIRRLSDEFDAFSTPGKGTVIVSRVRTDTDTTALPFVIGATCLPAPREEVCGDTWRVAGRGHDLAVMVADGLGHGPNAEEASALAARVFDRDPFVDDAPFYETAHAHLSRSRGAAVARAIVRASGEVQYAGVGNIAGTLIGPDTSRGLASQNGTVGAEKHRSILSQRHPWPSRGLLLMHSDGISTRWSLDAYPGLLLRHPATVAAVIARDFSRGRDDATTVVVRMLEGRRPS